MRHELAFGERRFVSVRFFEKFEFDTKSSADVDELGLSGLCDASTSCVFTLDAISMELGVRGKSVS